MSAIAAREFEYLTPATVDEALRHLSQPGARPVAGGTDLVIQMRAREISPTHLVDLAGLGLDYVRQDGGVVRIGAMTTMAKLVEADFVRSRLPCLAEAVAQIGGVQCRNMATLGGNLCSAVPCADSAPPLLALDARLGIAGKDGQRDLALDQFFIGPKQTALTPGELLVEVRVPVPPPNTGTSFYKLGRRKALILAVVNVAARITLSEDGREVAAARIALGAVAPTPMRAKGAEELLRGRALSEPLIDEAAVKAASEIAPISDLRAGAAYRREVSRVFVKRALQKAWQRARKEAGRPQVQGGTASVGVEHVATRMRQTHTASTATAGERSARLTVNGRSVEVRIRSHTLLVDVLRDQLGLLGTKLGCGTGECGACTILLDGLPVSACLLLAERAKDGEITTIEGFSGDGDLHPLQEAFVAHGAFQCGFCAPGVVLTAASLLERTPQPTEREVRYTLAGNLCRCTSYVKIVAAIQAAAHAMGGGASNHE